MVERTVAGADLAGGQFEAYTAEYAKKKGVSRDAVDMVLTEKMLRSIIVEDAGDGKVRLRMKKGTETKKAFNHNTGDTVPRRTWFGMYDSEAKRIAGEVKAEFPEQQTTAADIRRAIDGFDLEDITDEDGTLST